MRLLDWQRVVHRPSFSGWENLPTERPLLFVGNHTLIGFLDIPLLFRELWEREGIFLNALGDRVHFRIPGWRRVLSRYGAVEGSRENLTRLFESGACVLVFPGGAREVMKRKGEEHTLVWKQRLGFARMAIRHGVTIVPFAMVGVEEALDIVADANDLSRTPVGRLLDAVGVRDDLRPPVVRGIGPTPLPRPERFDYHFCPPVQTRGYGTDEGDDNAWEVRNAVASRIEEGIEHLRTIRAQRSPARR